VASLRSAAFVSVVLLAACSAGGSFTTGTVPAPRAADQTGAVRPLQMITRRLAVDPQTGAFVRGALAYDPVAASERQTQVAAAPINLSYYGGPVQTAPKIYLVWWGRSWASATPGADPSVPGAGDPHNLRAYAKAFLKAAQGSRWLNDVLQYKDANGVPTGNPTTMLVGSWNDTASDPPQMAVNQDMGAEALRAAQHFSMIEAGANPVVGTNVNYVIFLPTGTYPSGYVGMGGDWCAYHSYTFNQHDMLIPFTVMPYLPDVGHSCGVGEVNKPGTLDGVSIILGHEIAETMTDPHPNGVANPTGWIDANDDEIGDKCEWHGIVNNVYAGNYPTQPLWNNGTTSCRQGPPKT